MLKVKSTLSLLLLVLGILVFTGCGTGQQKNNEPAPETQNSEALDAYHQEQQELLQAANTRLAELNKKIMELNDKIKTKGSKLTEDQNNAIDTFEKKRAAINQRMHQIKNVSYNDWNAFKTKFEADLENCCADIDKLLTEL